MARPIVRQFSDAEQLSQAAAKELISRVRRATAGGAGKFHVALAGGSTPRRLYKILAEGSVWETVDWSGVHFYWSDERPVAADHPDSNFGMANDVLLKPLKIAEANVHRLRGETEDLDAAARAYQSEIAHSFGVDADGPPPHFDLILLGLGDDGHTASLFPDTPALTERERWVTANPVAKLNQTRLTFTAPLINAACMVWFIVTGDQKASVVKRIVEGPQDPSQLPAQLVKPAGPAIWYIDKSAAAQLQSRMEMETSILPINRG